MSPSCVRPTSPRRTQSWCLQRLSPLGSRFFGLAPSLLLLTFPPSLRPPPSPSPDLLPAPPRPLSFGHSHTRTSRSPSTARRATRNITAGARQRAWRAQWAPWTRASCMRTPGSTSAVGLLVRIRGRRDTSSPCRQGRAPRLRQWRHCTAARARTARAEASAPGWGRRRRCRRHLGECGGGCVRWLGDGGSSRSG